jgi:hypothetical protein
MAPAIFCSLGVLIQAIAGLAEDAVLRQVELLETHVAEGVEGVVNAKVFVG